MIPQSTPLYRNVAVTIDGDLNVFHSLVVGWEEGENSAYEAIVIPLGETDQTVAEPMWRFEMRSSDTQAVKYLGRTFSTEPLTPADMCKHEDPEVGKETGELYCDTCGVSGL